MILQEAAIARNGSGTMVVLNTYSSGAAITAAGFNDQFTDFAAEITNSLALDGQSTMTAGLKAANGSASLPGYAFGSDTNTGIYRIGADNLGIAVGGTKIVDVAATGITFTGLVAGFGVVPVGAITAYAGSSAPNGWLLCDGSSKVRTDYAALFSAIGTTYGSADGTHFTLPDLGGRVIAGKEASASRLTSGGSGVDGGTLGASGGAQTVTLSTTQIPSHTHTGTTGDDSPDHTHTVPNHASGGSNSTSFAAGASSPTGSGGPTAGASARHQHTFTTAATGGGGAHNNAQPTIILNYIIFAGV